jgi:hypothetical protein
LTLQEANQRFYILKGMTVSPLYFDKHDCIATFYILKSMAVSPLYSEKRDCTATFYILKSMTPRLFNSSVVPGPFVEALGAGMDSPAIFVLRPIPLCT